MEIQTATLAGGCFWCTEAVFEQLKGVTEVMSGYTGGDTENPIYEDVATGTTGHAEAIQITFDPTVITYEEILEVFWKLHDPTTLNQQGADHGTQYRSAIFYHDESQKKIAESSKAQLEASGYYKNNIVTQIEPFKKFFKAEGYHQDFYKKNSDGMYCKIVIDPKIEKLKSGYSKKLKTN